MKEEGGHGVDPDVIRRAEYFLYSMMWKVIPEVDGGLTLSSCNNTTTEVPYGLFVTFWPDGAMNISIDLKPDSRLKKREDDVADLPKHP
jgi:hypothetical protein